MTSQALLIMEGNQFFCLPYLFGPIQAIYGAAIKFEIAICCFFSNNPSHTKRSLTWSGFIGDFIARDQKRWKKPISAGDHRHRCHFLSSCIINISALSLGYCLPPAKGCKTAAVCNSIRRKKEFLAKISIS